MSELSRNDSEMLPNPVKHQNPIKAQKVYKLLKGILFKSLIEGTYLTNYRIIGKLPIEL